MSYTTVERLRSYLTANYAIAERVVDLPVTPRDSQPVRFWGCALETTSLRVKSLQAPEPVRRPVTLTAEGNVLTTSPITRGSVVAASDSSLGTVYIENRDYIVDYDGSIFHRKAGGSLLIGDTIVVWHVPMRTYVEGEDYSIDYEKAELRRLGGGGIASGETVYLDFVPVFAGFDDNLLASAVNEANGLIECEIDPDRQFGADASLNAAATCKALEIVCHSAASRELSTGRGMDRIALAWLKLAEGYKERGLTLLSSFRPPAAGPSRPTHS